MRWEHAALAIAFAAFVFVQAFIWAGPAGTERFVRWCHRTWRAFLCRIDHHGWESYRDDHGYVPHTYRCVDCGAMTGGHE